MHGGCVQRGAKWGACIAGCTRGGVHAGNSARRSLSSGPGSSGLGLELSQPRLAPGVRKGTGTGQGRAAHEYRFLLFCPSPRRLADARPSSDQRPARSEETRLLCHFLPRTGLETLPQIHLKPPPSCPAFNTASKVGTEPAGRVGLQQRVRVSVELRTPAFSNDSSCGNGGKKTPNPREHLDAELPSLLCRFARRDPRKPSPK